MSTLLGTIMFIYLAKDFGEETIDSSWLEKIITEVPKSYNGE